MQLMGAEVEVVPFWLQETAVAEKEAAKTRLSGPAKMEPSGLPQ